MTAPTVCGRSGPGPDSGSSGSHLPETILQMFRQWAPHNRGTRYGDATAHRPAGPARGTRPANAPDGPRRTAADPPHRRARTVDEHCLSAPW
ncbi:hypothetical protein GCM10010129_01510 [Streptomyces fumigatiscleroticus]|nr:hypothetical protein GCM10010129_01510 [Streptomyces fumigatiscleroticus]